MSKVTWPWLLLSLPPAYMHTHEKPSRGHILGEIVPSFNAPRPEIVMSKMTTLATGGRWSRLRYDCSVILQNFAPLDLGCSRFADVGSGNQGPRLTPSKTHWSRQRKRAIIADNVIGLAWPDGLLPGVTPALSSAANYIPTQVVAEHLLRIV